MLYDEEAMKRLSYLDAILGDELGDGTVRGCRSKLSTAGRVLPYSNKLGVGSGRGVSFQQIVLLKAT